MSMPERFEIGVCVNEPSLQAIEDFDVAKYTLGLKRIAAHRGFDVIEYSHVAHLTEGDARRIGQITRELGMRAWSIHSEHLNGNSPDEVKEYYRVQEICARNAEALGCRVLVFHPPNADFSDAECVSVLRTVADICRAHGLSAGLENVNRKYPVKKLCGFVNEAGRENLGFTIDTGHAELYEEGGAVGAIRQMAGRILSTHIQDTCGQTDDHLPPGLGRINWRTVLTELWQSGYAGPLMVELTGPAVKGRRSVESLRDIPLEVEQALTHAYLSFVAASLLDPSCRELRGSAS